MIRVMLVDDQEVVRSGLRMILDRYDDIEIVGESADGEHAVKLAVVARPDVVLMDIRMPICDGVVAAERMAASTNPPKMIMLTTFDLDDLLFAALRAGASGFLLKDTPGERIIDAIRAVAAGQALLDPAVTRRVIERLARGVSAQPPAEWALLTDREQQVVRIVATGASNAEIGAQLHLSEATIKSHVGAILAKLGLRDRTQVVVWAFHAGVH